MVAMRRTPITVVPSLPWFSKMRNVDKPNRSFAVPVPSTDSRTVVSRHTLPDNLALFLQDTSSCCCYKTQHVTTIDILTCKDTQQRKKV
jgi:hypothetical protein